MIWIALTWFCFGWQAGGLNQAYGMACCLKKSLIMISYDQTLKTCDRDKSKSSAVLIWYYICGQKTCEGAASHNATMGSLRTWPCLWDLWWTQNINISLTNKDCMPFYIIQYTVVVVAVAVAVGVGVVVVVAVYHCTIVCPVYSWLVSHVVLFK